ncbi:MAG: 30S ribosomal protein S13 [Thermoprotei archaeon]|nr:MAG: 30S ribosomal protein S13 [Thermoprotei archaeon]RLE82623.1 MAG: 30S ribosomal protein S13 [Thermoprotei archaeon]RLF02412.1 MAG: 30S ribosomal protein S13 [Thermoprotei archaeon]
MSEEFKYIVRIGDKDLPGDKRIAYALARIKGIGVNTAIAISRRLGIDPFQKIGSLSEADIKRLDEAIRRLHDFNFPYWFLNRPRDPQTGENLHLVGSELILRVKWDIELMKKIKCWKGIRHMLGLKVRGQRTRTTGRTGITVGVTKRRK